MLTNAYCHTLVHAGMYSCYCFVLIIRYVKYISCMCEQVITKRSNHWSILCWYSTKDNQHVLLSIPMIKISRCHASQQV